VPCGYSSTVDPAAGAGESEFRARAEANANAVRTRPRASRSPLLIGGLRFQGRNAHKPRTQGKTGSVRVEIP
jgi:hypothetical protein